MSAIGMFSQINVTRLPDRLRPPVHRGGARGRSWPAPAHLPGARAIGSADAGTPSADAAGGAPKAITANIVADLKGLQIREIGKHRLEMRAGDRVLGSTPFTINLMLQDRRAANA